MNSEANMKSLGAIKGACNTLLQRIVLGIKAVCS